MIPRNIKIIAWTIALVVAIGVANAAMASSTISTDITTGGNLNVSGTATLQNLTVNGTTVFNGTFFANIIPLQDTAANLAGVVASSGQMVYETDTKFSKVGDGVSSISSLSPLNLWKNNSSKIYYLSGNVGVGVSSPAFKLDVNGHIGNSSNGVVDIIGGSADDGSSPNLLEISPTQLSFGDINGQVDGTEMVLSGTNDTASIIISGAPVFTANTNSTNMLSPGNGAGVTVIDNAFGVGTTTPTANFQATNENANATTSIVFGRGNQNKGTCVTYYRSDGSPLYMYFPAGTTAPTYTTSKPSGCQ